MSNRTYDRHIDPDLSGSVLRAKIKKTWNDHCDVILIDGESGKNYAIHGRLYQHDSLAWKKSAVLGQLPEYKVGCELLVYVVYLREHGGELLWFVHERWGNNNPWVALDLKEEVLIYGSVSRVISANHSGERAGYLIQLDAGTPWRDIDGDEIAGTSSVQPDIQVFLPVGEVPCDEHGFPLPLEEGERVQAIMLDASQRPPRHPTASIQRLISARDARSVRYFDWQEAAALTSFRMLKNKEVLSFSLAEKTADLDPPLSNLPIDGKVSTDFLYERRLLMIDDDPRTLEVYSDLYQRNGAYVNTVLVAPGRFSVACNEVAQYLQTSDFDLVMVDMNLPGRGLGERLLQLVRAKLLGIEKPLRFLLLSANLSDTTSDTQRQAQLRQLGVVGICHRPLSPKTFELLLNGGEYWQTSSEIGSGSVSTHHHADPDHELDKLLKRIAQEPEVTFSMLVKLLPERRYSLQIAAGSAPFYVSELESVLASTELHLLASGRLDVLKVDADEGGNERLRSSQGTSAFWTALESEGERWLFGIGHRRTWSPDGMWPWWREAIAARLSARNWLAWTQQASTFVELGMAHHGLHHEVFNLRNEMDGLLATCELVLKQTTLDLNTFNVLLRKMRRAHEDMLSLAENLLDGLHHRTQLVHLPSALDTIRSIVTEQSKRDFLSVDFGTAPPIALGVPSAAIVLPIVNLLLNSAKHHFRAENRRASLVFRIRHDAERSWLHADVRDNGPGLNKTARATLWQAGQSQARDIGERHGMGLWLSRRLVNAAGGSLECIEDWRWLGSHFRLALPIEF